MKESQIFQSLNLLYRRRRERRFFFSFAVVGSGPCVCDGDGGERECLLAATALAPIIGHMYFAKLYF